MDATGKAGLFQSCLSCCYEASLNGMTENNTLQAL
jgi:hypothetical protein